MDLGYKLRQDFPIFKNGICYLDSGASSQKPQSVIDKQKYYTEEVYVMFNVLHIQLHKRLLMLMKNLVKK